MMFLPTDQPTNQLTTELQNKLLTGSIESQVAGGQMLKLFHQNQNLGLI